MATLDERSGCTSASNALADSMCPGRHLAQRGLPEIVSGDAASGTKIHRALATQNPSDLSLSERDIYDACTDIEGEQVKKFFGAASSAQVVALRESPNDPAKGRYWVRVPKAVGDATEFYEHSGKPDVVYRNGNRALIAEYKTLVGDIPESSKNLQLRDQQCLVRGSLLIQGEIGVVVVQPLVTRNPEICVYTAEDTTQAALEMFDRIRASNNPKSLRVAGEIQCAFCKAKTRCLEYQRWASAMVPALVSLDVPATDWTAEQCVVFLAGASKAQKWIDETKEMIKAKLLSNPDAVPGYRLKPGNISETITDVQECFNRFIASGGTDKQFMGAVKVLKGALKEALSEATRLRGGPLANKLKAITNGITETKQNAPSIVKVGDE